MVLRVFVLPDCLALAFLGLSVLDICEYRKVFKVNYTEEQLKRALDMGNKLFDDLRIKYGEENAEKLCSHKLLTKSGAYFTKTFYELVSVAEKIALFNDMKRIDLKT